jgi:hypothetical protein
VAAIAHQRQPSGVRGGAGMKKTNATKADAPKVGGAGVDRAGGLGSADKSTADARQSTIDAAAIKDKSTSTEAQLRKLLALLRQGPKTTVDLRQHAIMMPAARVHQLRHQQNYQIRTERIDLYDPEGVRHAQCARYHLIEPVPGA